MRVTRFGAMAFGLGALVFSITILGCANKESTDNPKSETGDKSSTKTATKTGLKPGTGTFKGKVTLVGDMPDIGKLNAELKALMDKADATQKPACIEKAPKEDKEQQDWKIGPNKEVGDVFVFFKPVTGTFFEFSESDEAVKAAKAHNKEIKQPHCAFHPHALSLFPEYRDSKNKKVENIQYLVIDNNAEIAHNTKIESFNQSIPSMSKKDDKDLKPSPNPISIGCSVHPWMNANILVLDHPYVSITNEKGDFEIKNVPTGKVTINVWHPKAGYVAKEDVDFKSGESKEKSYELKAK
jgi:hypothetical protein